MMHAEPSLLILPSEVSEMRFVSGPSAFVSFVISQGVTLKSNIIIRLLLRLPASLAVTTHAAKPMLRVTGEARQQFARARCLDHRDGAIAPHLSALRIERHQQMQPLAGVGVDDRDQRGVRMVEVTASDAGSLSRIV